MNNSSSLIQYALTHHVEGRLSEAEAGYRQVLEVDPCHPQALGMLGMILLDGARKAEAEPLLLRHLESEPDNPVPLHNLGRLLQDKGSDTGAIALFRRAIQGKPDFVPALVDMAISLHRLGCWEEALAALDQALSVDPGFGAAHDQRGLVLYDLERCGEAAEAHLAALACTSVDAGEARIPILLHLSCAAYGAAEWEVAERACRAIFELDADNEGALDQLVVVLTRLRRDEEVRFLLNRLVRSRGLVTTTRCEVPEAYILLLGGAGAALVPTPYLFDTTLFATTELTLLSPDQPDAPLGSVNIGALAGVDLIFNTVGEPERDGGQLKPVETLAARLGKPLLNPPERVARTGRDQSQALYGDIPGLVVPGVRRMARDELSTLSAFAEPFLIRPCGVHGGEDMVLIKTHADLTAYLARVPFDNFLLIDFHDFKGGRDCYRKYRFIFVDRQPFPYHLAIGDHWMVHYWRARMGRDDWKKQEEEEFLTDWRLVFGAKAAAIVDQVGRRMDLDYGGMDCSLLPDGEVLLFEANACMRVHLEDPELDFPYKYRAVPLIRDAMTRMVRDRVARQGKSN